MPDQCTLVSLLKGINQWNDVIIYPSRPVEPTFFCGTQKPFWRMYYFFHWPHWGSLYIDILKNK